MSNLHPDNGLESPSFLIVGGGITGLSLALALARQGQNVTLIEECERLGGNIHSVTEQGWQMELGPNTLLAKPSLYRLIDSLGLADKAIFSPTASKKRYVVKDGKPLALPSSLTSALRHPLLGYKEWFYLLSEPFRKPVAHEETLAAFIERRLGPRILNYIVDPFVSGVYAGDPQRLSAQGAMPRLHRLEQVQGSLLRGSIAQMRNAKAQRRQERADGFPDGWRGTLISFPEGLATLTQAMANELAQHPSARIVTGSRVERVSRPETLWHAIDQHGRSFQGHQLILTTPAHINARLLEHLDPRLQSALDQIVYPPLAAVALGYPSEAITQPLDGFGMLVPGKENRQTLGALFSSTLFPDRAPEGHALLTCFIGGRKNPGIAEQPDDELITVINTELGEILGIREAPVFTRVARWPHAIPQYEVGHLERVAAIEERTAQHPGLHLMGNWRDGISVGDCIDNGHAMAQRLLAGTAKPHC